MGKELAVRNPLAREMVDAVQALGLGLSVVFEPGKTHPKDWSNPGRVRVLVKEGGRVKDARVQNSPSSVFLRAFVGLGFFPGGKGMWRYATSVD